MAAIEPDYIKNMIEAGLSGAQVSVTGDGSHFEAIVISEAFRGKGPLEKHRLVYSTLGDQMSSGTIHALSIRAYTPEEWQNRRS